MEDYLEALSRQKAKVDQEIANRESKSATVNDRDSRSGASSTAEHRQAIANTSAQCVSSEAVRDGNAAQQREASGVGWDTTQATTGHPLERGNPRIDNPAQKVDIVPRKKGEATPQDSVLCVEQS